MRQSYVKRRWVIADMDRKAARALAEAAEVPTIVAHLMLQRGIDTPEQARLFLKPSLKHLCNPFTLTDMDRAVARITEARDRGEHVLVFGDYDVDGISGTAVMLNGLKRFGIEKCSYGMPHRLNEGYGLNAERVEAAKADGVSLIVTVDNGIAAHDAAARAKALGVDLIVTDHHSIENGLPEALAIINPKRDPDDHPASFLCGAGVAFKLSTALNGTPNDLDIATLGTVADIVPLKGENRVIVSLGLRHMAIHNRVGLAKLAQAAGVDIAGIAAEHIGFQLGPRINAAGRMDDGIRALELLLTEDDSEAETIARELNDANQDRREIEKTIFDDAVEELEAFFTPEQRSIVLARRGWHAGVIGIVASRVYHRYHRPTVLIAVEEDGVGRGSARCGNGFNMVGAFNVCQAHLEQFGGHGAAAGMTILEESIDAFRTAMEAEGRVQLGTGELEEDLPIDVLASFSEIDAGLLNGLQQLEPIGHENPAPLFCSLGVEVVPQSIRILKDQHLKLAVRQGDTVFGAIGFGMAERFYTESFPQQIDIAYTPQFNTWRGETKIQLLLKDIR